MLAGTQAAQIWRKVEEIPKGLLPSNNSVGTVSPINIPATDQCQGCFINSMIIFSNFIVKIGKKINSL